MQRQRHPTDIIVTPTYNALSDELIDAELPTNFVIPIFNGYNGTTDPYDHLLYYSLAMTVHGRSDVILCQAFAASLKGAALVWMSNLRPRSIHSYEELTRAFLTRFQASMKQQQTMQSVMNMRQEARETIREFYARFTKVTLEVKNLPKGVVYGMLWNGVMHHDLVQSLALDLPKTMPKLLRRCNQYANMEEVLTARGIADRDDQSEKEKKRTLRPRDDSSEPKKNRTDRPLDTVEPEQYELDRS
ncbi:uncharacterized protein LOC122064803 [Macadamia integrifolia]|uniref:uncharacterized protein LOC122064803 n=1 Tax=Macadamia integrifolia TaxID=60698 RepID=UPI001C4ECAC7|nr:uncharacterized protein LOC122064803 [Macadamia integrifolia]